MSLRILTDPIKIKAWMSDRKATPARAIGTTDELRVKFSDEESELESISWEQFSQMFRDGLYVMLVDEEPGKNFYKIYRHK